MTTSQNRNNDTHVRSNVGEILPAAAIEEATARQSGTLEETIRKEQFLDIHNESAAALEDQSYPRSARRGAGRPRKREVTERKKNQELLANVLKEAKQDLRDLFVKREKVIRKLGFALEKVLPRASAVCQAIKDALAEEIADKVISARNIERHCLDKWKITTKPTKPQKNDNLSFSEEKRDEESTSTTKELKSSVSSPNTQQAFKIKKEKFAAVLEAINRSNSECYVWFDDTELVQIRADTDVQDEEG